MNLLTFVRQCDETHPTCNNCKKSKRDCAGYDPIFKPQLTDAAPVQTTTQSSPPNGTTSASTAQAVSPPPPPSSSSTSFASVMASTRPSLGKITSPSLLKRPLYRFSAPSNSGSAASSYCSAIIPSSPPRTLSEYPPNTAISSRCNGDNSSHQSNANEHDDRRSSHESHCKGDTYKLEASSSIYSSRSAVSPQENEGPVYDVAAHAYKNDPRGDYWADRLRPVFTNSSSEPQGFRRYN